MASRISKAPVGATYLFRSFGAWVQKEGVGSINISCLTAREGLLAEPTRYRGVVLTSSRGLRRALSLQRLINRRSIIQQNPLDNRQRQAAILDQVVVKLAEAEVLARSVAILSQQSHNLPLAGHVINLLRRTGGRAGRFTFGGFAIQAARLHEIFHGLLERPPAGVQIYIYSNSGRAITRQPQHLSLRR